MPIDSKAIDSKNQSNLKAVPSGGKIKYQYTMLNENNRATPVVLIGTCYKPEIVKAVAESKHFAGEIEVLREPIKGKGELKVTGCGANRAQFDAIIARTSKKKVFYV